MLILQRELINIELPFYFESFLFSIYHFYYSSSSSSQSFYTVSLLFFHLTLFFLSISFIHLPLPFSVSCKNHGQFSPCSMNIKDEDLEPKICTNNCDNSFFMLSLFHQSNYFAACLSYCSVLSMSYHNCTLTD